LSDDDERLRNIVLFDFYGTNREINEASPFIVVGVVVVILIFVLSSCFHNDQNIKPGQKVDQKNGSLGEPK
jgi:hypothetical protein